MKERSWRIVRRKGLLFWLSAVALLAVAFWGMTDSVLVATLVLMAAATMIVAYVVDNRYPEWKWLDLFGAFWLIDGVLVAVFFGIHRIIVGAGQGSLAHDVRFVAVLIFANVLLIAAFLDAWRRKKRHPAT